MSGATKPLSDDDRLGLRTSLPADIRPIEDGVGRPDWPDHPGFQGLAAFWLDRHRMFRQLMAEMSGATTAFLDRTLEEREFAQRLSQYGGFFLNQLHTHHQMEDRHYFPLMVRLEPSLERGFALLDQDHVSLDAAIHQFAENANEILTAVKRQNPADDRAKAFLEWLASMEQHLSRHLEDEEDIVIPVLLKHGVE